MGAPLVVWAPRSIRSRMQAVRLSTGTRYLDQILDAVEATIDELPDLVAQAQGERTVSGRLFERALPAQEPVQESEDYKIQLLVRGILASHLAVLDELVEKTGAKSRSALIVTALDHTLPQL